jgi:6-pyruvoyltetrahydropterin/6-carboxytetrahydropterin synthase
MPVTSLSILFEFSASHRLYRPELSDSENLRLFGKCSNPNGHGHNYTLEVRISGPVESPGEMVVDASRVKTLVEDLILKDVDHKDLNRDTLWLNGKVPTTEVLANAVFARLSEGLGSISASAVLDSVTLHETRRISVTVRRG